MTEKHTQEMQQVELSDEALEPVAGGATIAVDPDIGTNRWNFDESATYVPLGKLDQPVLKDPLARVGGGVNRGFPGTRPEVEDGTTVTGKVEVSWSNGK